MSAAPALPQDLIPDLEETRRFLAALAPGETHFTFQTYADDKERKDGALSAILHGTLDQRAAQLGELNARGAAICVVVNRTDLKGRAERNVTAVRAVYADFDGVPLGRADRLPLAPHLIVESSPGRWHVYYRVEDVPRERFGEIQRMLIEQFGSDPQVHDLPRVMRLPGFWHQKGEPFMTRIEHEDGAQSAYGLSDFPHGTEPAAESDVGAVPADNVLQLPPEAERTRALGMAEEKAAYTHRIDGGRRSAMAQLAYDLKAAAVSRPIANLAAKAFAKACRPTDSEGQPAPFPEKVALDLVANAYRPGKVVNPRSAADDKKPRPANHAAAMDALRGDPRLSNLVRYDEMLRTVVLMGPIPGGRRPTDEMRELGDHDVSALLEYLQRNGMPRLSFDTLWKAVQQRARECGFHPLKDYLNGLCWDGTDRLATWLSRYLGAADDAYTHAIGRMFMIAMVARAFRPGCKVDYMLILEGVQSAAKSTTCAILGGAWFSDQLPDIRGDKDASLHLNGKWLIEVSELSSMSKADANALKAFITRQTERYRPSYGRAEVTEPRQCVFIGTTNKTDYLRDETGGRRFWPVKVADRIDTDGLRAVRDQLFAEAVERFRRGEHWWPDAETEAAIIKPEQEARFEADVWEEQIVSRLSEEKPSRITVLDVLTAYITCGDAGGIHRLGTREQRRVAAILERIGWQHGKKGSRGERWWIPGPGWEPRTKPPSELGAF